MSNAVKTKQGRYLTAEELAERADLISKLEAVKERMKTEIRIIDRGKAYWFPKGLFDEENRRNRYARLLRNIRKCARR